MEEGDSYKRGKGDGDCLKEGEGISQRTYIKDLWTQTAVWGLTMESKGRLGGDG